jgi:hypothetical protein
MEQIPGNSEKTWERGIGSGQCFSEHDTNKKEHTYTLNQEKEEGTEVKPEYVLVSPQGIVKSQGRGNKRTVTSVTGKRAECIAIGKKMRNLMQAADIGIVYNGMGIIKMEGILKMIGIGKPYSQKEKDTEEDKLSFAFHGSKFTIFATLYGIIRQKRRW